MEAGTPPPPPAPPPSPEDEARELSPQEAARSDDPAERMDGLRAWVAMLDRKLGTRFYALAAASVLALAAGIVAVVLVLGLKDDSATKGQLEDVRKDLAGVEREASTAADEELDALDERIAELESQVGSIRSGQTSSEREISVIQDDIDELRDDVSQLESNPQSSSGNSGDENP